MHKCLEQAPEAATEPPTAHLFMLQPRLLGVLGLQPHWELLYADHNFLRYEFLNFS